MKCQHNNCKEGEFSTDTATLLPVGSGEHVFAYPCELCGFLHVEVCQCGELELVGAITKTGKEAFKIKGDVMYITSKERGSDHVKN